MPSNSYLSYGLTIMAAMALRVLPLPAVLENFNPDWVFLVLVYWSLAAPEKYGVFNAWFVGLLVDVLTGRVLGQYALIYALISYICVQLHKRIRHYLLPQQSLFIFVCLVFGQFIIFWIERMQASNQLPAPFWFPVFTGTLAWPLVYMALRYVRSLGRFV